MLKPTRRALKKKADKLWAEIVKSVGRCLKCGSRDKQLQAAHIISRRFTNTRHDIRNGLCLCAACHRWAHDYPTAFGRFAESLRGRETIEQLEKQSKFLTKPDYEAVIAELMALKSSMI